MINLEKYEEIKSQLLENVTLVAISKTKPVEDIKAFYDAGQRIFGENRALELKDKYEALPSDIEWHMVGHLQRNKVKEISIFVDTIHSGDSKRILKEIDKEAKKFGRIIKVLLQIKIAKEDSKYGWSFDKLLEFLSSNEFSMLKNIMITGVMGMATFTDDRKQIKKEFKTLKKYFDVLKKDHFGDNFTEISMGMSGDFNMAIDEGSTMIRLGSVLFGERG